MLKTFLALYVFLIVCFTCTLQILNSERVFPNTSQYSAGHMVSQLRLEAEKKPLPKRLNQDVYRASYPRPLSSPHKVRTLNTQRRWPPPAPRPQLEEWRDTTPEETSEPRGPKRVTDYAHRGANVPPPVSDAPPVETSGPNSYPTYDPYEPGSPPPTRAGLPTVPQRRPQKPPQLPPGAGYHHDTEVGHPYGGENGLPGAQHLPGRGLPTPPNRGPHQQMKGPMAPGVRGGHGRNRGEPPHSPQVAPVEDPFGWNAPPLMDPHAFPPGTLFFDLEGNPIPELNQQYN